MDNDYIGEPDKRESNNRYISYALPADDQSHFGRSSSYYMNPALRQYIQQNANLNSINQNPPKSRKSSATDGAGLPIHTGGGSVPYSNPASSSSLSSASYSFPLYPNPGGYGPIIPTDHDYYDDEKKKKGIALSIALPLALVLGPLAFLGIVAIANFRAIMTVGVIRSLCTNINFASTYGSLCNVINNIGKRSLLPWVDEGGDWLGLSKLIHPEIFLSMIERLQAPEMNEMDHLKN